MPTILRASMVLPSLMNWTGCAGSRVIRSDRVVTPIRAGASFVAPTDGWFLSDTIYIRDRKAVANQIQEVEGKPVKGGWKSALVVRAWSSLPRLRVCLLRTWGQNASESEVPAERRVEAIAAAR